MRSAAGPFQILPSVQTPDSRGEFVHRLLHLWSAVTGEGDVRAARAAHDAAISCVTRPNLLRDSAAISAPDGDLDLGVHVDLLHPRDGADGHLDVLALFS